jgi:hypothetical protein
MYMCRARLILRNTVLLYWFKGRRGSLDYLLVHESN